MHTIAALQRIVQPWRAEGMRVGFVPTMGALHEGHARLIERAVRDCRRVVVSIFVNPLQFDRPDDLAGYPRTLDADLRLCEDMGADVVFTPTDGVMYPMRPECTVDVGTLADHLCGRYRPGHFRGVATVVLKLFGIVGADVAYFGEKDAQQLAIVRRLVADLNVPVAIEAVETVREADGLALSSRNRRLTPDQRPLAPCLYRALMQVREAIEHGDTDAAGIVRAAAGSIPPHPMLRLEYLELVEPVTIQPIGQVTGTTLAAGALWVGETRLIDNVTCEPPTPSRAPAHDPSNPV